VIQKIKLSKNLFFGTIILLPKGSGANAKQIQQYRPTYCLLNVSFKTFTKVATNRIVLVAQTQKVIRPSQTAFTLGRNIMKGAIILHETIHEL
jgi:hypothetical protein